VGGVAEVVVQVAVRLVQGEGADHDGERLEGLGGVRAAALAGHHAFNVGLDGQGGGHDQCAVAGGDAEGMTEGEPLAVGSEGDRAGQPDGCGRAAIRQGQAVAGGAERGGTGEGAGMQAGQVRRVAAPSGAGARVTCWSRHRVQRPMRRVAG